MKQINTSSMLVHPGRQKVLPFRVLVHSPSKRTSTLSGAHIIYSVTSFFHVPSSEQLDAESVDFVNSSPNTKRITVNCRFSHFAVLHTALTRRLPGIALPPLPERPWENPARIVRHPVARYAEILTFFLSCESEQVSVTSYLGHGTWLIVRWIKGIETPPHSTLESPIC